ncbi:hypothetical protein CJ030_MR7G027944 [Morella rubra]|uniref:Uncharacterized protein n=1 Tax=Morella rubra TaxID=262757 RepID=A0A6A1UZV5_9ROSI|nr:hypothetical protein CJ030_MR7G027944 [Morella rubra]
MVNLEGMVETAISPMHQLCIGLETGVSSIETQMTALQPFLSITLGTLHVMSRRLGAIEDQLGKMRGSGIDCLNFGWIGENIWDLEGLRGTNCPSYGQFGIRLSVMLSMDLSEKNITNAGAQIERPTWAKELVVELNAIQMEVFAVRDHMSQMYLSLHTVLIQIRTLIKQVDNMEEQLEHVRDKNKIKLEHVRDAVRQDVDEPVRCRDSY